MKTENKKLKEMMVAENSDQDDVEMKIEELKCEFTMMIKGLNDILPDEKAIIVKIKEVLV